MQGWRVTMEDSHATVLDLKRLDEEEADDPIRERVSFFGVYDGHGGGLIRKLFFFKKF